MLATVARFLDPWEAYVVRARLEADGIPASVAFANHAIVNWPMSLALGGTLVQVPADCLAQARQIYADYQAGTFEAELNAATGSHSEHCPRCGSTDFKRSMRWRKRLVSIFIVFTFAAYPTRRSRLICRQCGHQWDWGDG